MSDKVKREELVIDVKTEAIENLVKTNTRLADENKEMRDCLFKQKKEKLGCTDDDVQTIDDLRLWEAEQNGFGVRSNANNSFNGGSAGRSSLNDDGLQSDNQTFGSRKDLVTKCPDQVQEKLWSKVVQGIKEQDGKLAMNFVEAEKEFSTEGVYHTNPEKFKLGDKK